jgi:hypothetical protein
LIFLQTWHINSLILRLSSMRWGAEFTSSRVRLGLIPRDIVIAHRLGCFWIGQARCKLQPSEGVNDRPPRFVREPARNL